MSDVKPPITAELVWAGALQFGATTGTSAIVVDGEGAAGPSPMQAVAIGVAGCMAVDVATILTKGRHPLNALRVSFVGERLPDPPRRFHRIVLTFHVGGDVPSEAVERAIALSRQTYCSVWHSMRQDIAFETVFEIHP
jgi:putative redox protein